MLLSDGTGADIRQSVMERTIQSLPQELRVQHPKTLTTEKLFACVSPGGLQVRDLLGWGGGGVDS